ncbi:barstar family protein [Streptacidiphilus melanogenes]|uniref:barstar family protein n=1 Tax=Streptacidiphilus melanogenes TaxID=411235 RepID=UPI0006932E15|nr:barstar family protein [Streptacidiphilus melanogenes]
MITIDVGAVEDERQLHDLLAFQLDFPSFYGRNWDAFWDAVKGLVEIPSHLRLVGWNHLVARVPLGAAMLRSQLGQYRSEYRPDLRVEFDSDGPASDET